MKILIVDDEQLDLFITKKLLSLSYDVEGFTSLQEAADWAGKNKFDILVSDFYLGQGIHAPDVLRKVREAVSDPFTAVVLSNHIDEQQAEALKKTGFDAVIEKPITLEKFKEAVG